MGDSESADVCIECSRLEDGRILLQVGDDWVITLTPYAGRILSGQLHDVTMGRQYASSTFSTIDATLLAS